MDNQEKTKICPRCKENKNLDDDYYSSKSTYNQKQVYCKVCNRQMDKIKREKCKANGPTLTRTHKICVTCKIDKPLEEYPISRDKPDWHLSYCKKCWTEYVKAHKVKK